MGTNDKRPNEKLRYQRELRGWSQKKVADLLDTSKEMVSRWECGERPPGKYYQEKLCVLYDKSAQELGFLEEASNGSRNNAPDPCQETERDYSALILGNSSEVLSPTHINRLFLRKIGRLKTWLVDTIDDSTRVRWQLYYTSSNKLTGDGLKDQIFALEQLADESGGEQTKLSRVLAQNYQLAGSLARDEFRYEAARDYFRKAQVLIDAQDFPDMVSTAIAREGLAYLRQGHELQALKLYRDAADISLHAMPHVQAYVLSGLAEVLARHGQKDECYATLDRAEVLFQRMQTIPIDEDFAYVRLTQQSLQDTRGECSVLLGDIQQGLAYLQIAEQEVDQKMSRNYCRLLMQHAEAFYSSGQPDQCVEYALKGLQLARTLDSTSNVHWSREIYVKLAQSAWQKEAVVNTLAEALKQ